MSGLVLLSRPPLRPTAPDAVEMLIACHGRVRHFLALAQRLCENDAEPELGSAAAAVHRYFTVALPLHATDEDTLLAPALLDRSGDLVLASALAAMSTQHEALEASIEVLAPRWRRLSEVRVEDPDWLRALGESTRIFVELFNRHMEMEEQLIFPALRRKLSARQLLEMAEAIRARREGAHR